MTPDQFFVGFTVAAIGVSGYVLGAAGAPAFAIVYFIGFGFLAPVCWGVKLKGATRVVDGFKRFKIVEPSRARCPDCGIPTVPDHEGLTADDMRCDSCDGGE